MQWKIPRRLTPREPTFQVVLEAIALTPFKLDKKKRFKLTLEVFRDIFQICPRVQGRDFDALPSEEVTISFLTELGHTREINSLNDVVVDQMHQPWRTFAALINRGLSRKTGGLNKLCLFRAQILWESTKSKKRCTTLDLTKLSFTTSLFKKRHFLGETKLGCTSPTFRFVSAKESTHIYRAILPKTLTSPEMKESKAYKTYLGYVSCDVPPKIARKFKKASPSKKDNSLVPVDDELAKKVESSLVTSGTPGLSPIPSLVTEDLVFSTLGGVSAIIPEPLGSPEHRECNDGLIKSYHLDKDFFSSYDVYLLKQSRKDKDKDEGPSAGSDRGFKKRKTSKDAEPTTEVPEFEVAETYMPQDQGGDLGNDDDEPRKESASKCDWFTKLTRPQEPNDPDWNIGKTLQKGPTQNWLMSLVALSLTDKSLKSFDELMSTLIYFSAYIMKPNF
nr:hypothetical protein [Tanacetum cinerariifolium]